MGAEGDDDYKMHSPQHHTCMHISDIFEPLGSWVSVMVYSSTDATS